MCWNRRMDAAQLRSVADELYASPIDTFTASRNARAAEEKKRGAASLAEAIRALTKPTSAAWAMNALVRSSPAALEPVASLRDRIESITAAGDRDDLREATRDRHAVVARLVEDARSLAAESGVSLSVASSAELSDAVLAALADADVEAALRTGRLVTLPRTGGMAASDIRALVAAPPDGLAQNRDDPDAEEGGADSDTGDEGGDTPHHRAPPGGNGHRSILTDGSARSSRGRRRGSESSTTEQRRLERDLAAAEGAEATARADRLTRETEREVLATRLEGIREDLARKRDAVRVAEEELADAEDRLDSVVADIRSRELEWKRTEAVVRRLRRTSARSTEGPES